MTESRTQMDMICPLLLVPVKNHESGDRFDTFRRKRVLPVGVLSLLSCFQAKTCSTTKINIARLLKLNMFCIDTFCGKRVLPAIFVTVLLSLTRMVHLRRRVGILRYRHTLEKEN